MFLNLDNWEATRSLFYKDYGVFGIGAGIGASSIDWFIGIVQKRTRLFLPGDLVLGTFDNGQGTRWQVYGRSGRGFNVSRVFMDFHRDRERRKYDGKKCCGVWFKQDAKEPMTFSNRTTARLFVWPDGSVSRTGSIFYPAIRACLDAYAQALAASPVGACSGTLLSDSETEKVRP